MTEFWHQKLTGEQSMNNRRLPTLKERLEQIIKQGKKHRSRNNQRLKKLALRKQTTGEQFYE